MVLETTNLEKGVENIFNNLIKAAKEKLKTIESKNFEYKISKFLLLRYEGNDYNISVPEPKDKDYKKEFETCYKREYAFFSKNVI